MTRLSRPDGYVTSLLADAIERHLRAAAGAAEAAADLALIDMGCGPRPYASMARRLGFRYVSADIVDGADVRLIPGERCAAATGTYDVALSTQVLEHVWDLDWYLAECKRLLRPDGLLVLSTHGSWPYHPEPTDFRRWTRDGLVRELTDRDFAVESVDAIMGPIAWTTQFKVLGVHHVLRHWPGVRRLLGPVYAAMNLWMRLLDGLTPRPIVTHNACVYVTVSRVRPVSA